MPETHQRTRPVCEYTRPVVRRVGGGEEGALKAVQGLPSCAPHPVTKHRIHHFCLLLTIECIQKRSRCNVAVRSLAGGSETAR